VAEIESAGTRPGFILRLIAWGKIKMVNMHPIKKGYSKEYAGTIIMAATKAAHSRTKMIK
jgi:hypothetical protein